MHSQCWLNPVMRRDMALCDISGSAAEHRRAPDGALSPAAVRALLTAVEMELPVVSAIRVASARRGHRPTDGCAYHVRPAVAVPSAAGVRAQGLRGTGVALERMADSYSGWRSAIWSATAAPAPRPIADPHLLAASLQRAVAETANDVRATATLHAERRKRSYLALCAGSDDLMPFTLLSMERRFAC